MKCEKIRNNLDKISDILNKVVSFLCVGLTALMFVAVFVQVIGRYLLKSGTAWTEETARYSMIWLAFLGASSLIRSWDNTSVTFLKDKLPGKAREIVDILIMVIMLAFMIEISVIAVQQIPKLALRETSPALGISMFIPRSSVIFGSIIVCIQLLWRIMDAILLLVMRGGENR